MLVSLFVSSEDVDTRAAPAPVSECPSGTVKDSCHACSPPKSGPIYESSCVIPFCASQLDDCGVCGGNSDSCMGCDGIPNSKTVYDLCGVCDSDSLSCIGCDGVINSGMLFDACGVCGGNCEESSGHTTGIAIGISGAAVGVGVAAAALMMYRKRRATDAQEVLFSINEDNLHLLENPLFQSRGHNNPLFEDA